MKPIKVRCRLCSEEIELNEDSDVARENRTDPHQQLRLHLRQRHLYVCDSLAYKVGYLIDALAFAPVTEKDRWRNHLIGLVDYFQGMPE